MSKKKENMLAEKRKKAENIRSFLNSAGRYANATTRQELQQEYAAANAAGNLELELSKLVQAGRIHDYGVESYEIEYVTNEMTVTGIVRFKSEDDVDFTIDATFESIYNRTGYKKAGSVRDVSPSNQQVIVVGATLILDMDKALDIERSGVVSQSRRIPEKNLLRTTGYTQSGKQYQCVELRRAV